MTTHSGASSVNRRKLRTGAGAMVIAALTGGFLTGFVPASHADETPGNSGGTACTPSEGYTDCLVFAPGAVPETFTVPERVDKLDVHMWGAGGSSASDSRGGGGGYVHASVPVAEGAEVGVKVSAGTDKKKGSADGGGAVGDKKAGFGGGLSALWLNKDGKAEAVAIAGGGGGAGTESKRDGGAGGGADGQESAMDGGKGAAGAKGGAGGKNGGNGGDAGQPGTAGDKGSAGGQPIKVGDVLIGGGGGGGNGSGLAHAGGGGGGGGYAGGGGGGSKGGGGGGSSYLAPGVEGETLAGNGSGAGGAEDPHYTAGVGEGGRKSSGGAGSVVVQWKPVPIAPLVIDSPAEGAKVEGLRPEISGTGEPGSEVGISQVWSDLTMKTTVGKDGRWKVTPHEDLRLGKVQLMASQTRPGETEPDEEIVRNFTTYVKAEPVPVDPAAMSELALADVDGDGKADTIAKPGEDKGALYWFKGNGDITHQLGKKVFDTWENTQTRAADFDGDGKADLLAVDKGGKLQLWKGKGDGTFEEPKEAASWTGMEQTTTGDFDGDGKADVVALETATNELKLWRGTGDIDAPFKEPLTLTKWVGFTQTTAANVNGDKYADLVAMTKDEDGRQILKYWRSNGNVTGNPFEKPQFLTTWGSFGQTTAGDYDGDGKDDLTAVDTKNNQLKGWRSLGETEGNPFEKPKVVKLMIPQPQKG
ncbi:FG-GAP-like repeat-containing protein [Streptomyces sp. NPDC050504]|uniref:FG-GAP repeat domain-containing protein n=1 Tax=Streptomyces sp. NPDC050504 TaxID=3365618 RepID=UPI00379C3A4D